MNSTHTVPQHNMRQPAWMPMVVAWNVGAVALYAISSFPYNHGVTQTLNQVLNFLMAQLPEPFQSGTTWAFSLMDRVMCHLFPATLVWFALRHSRLRQWMVLNRLTMGLMLAAGAGMVLHLIGALCHRVLEDFPYPSDWLGGWMEPLLHGTLIAGYTALVVTTVWYQWLQPRGAWVNVLKYAWARL
jgi:hypothetical protein